MFCVLNSLKKTSAPPNSGPQHPSPPLPPSGSCLEESLAVQKVRVLEQVKNYRCLLTQGLEGKTHVEFKIDYFSWSFRHDFSSGLYLHKETNSFIDGGKCDALNYILLCVVPYSHFFIILKQTNKQINIT